MAWHIQPSEAWGMTHHEWWDLNEFKDLGKATTKAPSIDEIRDIERKYAK